MYPNSISTTIDVKLYTSLITTRVATLGRFLFGSLRWSLYTSFRTSKAIRFFSLVETQADQRESLFGGFLFIVLEVISMLF